MLRVFIKLMGEFLTLSRQMKEKGLESKTIRGGTIIYLPENNEGSYLLPSNLPENVEKIFFVEATEDGGGMTNTGYATVVCGLAGKMLKPYFTPRGGHLSNGTHGYFSVPKGIVTVDSSKKEEMVSIQKHLINVSKETVSLKTEEIWSGYPKELPIYLEKYKAAVDAAYEKANCYHCRCLHYAAVK